MTTKEQIIEALTHRYSVKLAIHRLALAKFTLLKMTLIELVNEYNRDLGDENEELKAIYKDKGGFEAELKIGGELLIFDLHTNIFQVDTEQELWKTPFFVDNELNGMCAIVSVYNFISDSIKYSRPDDLGYLIGRLFINKDEHFYLEGKYELEGDYKGFEESLLGKSEIRNVLESTILYAMNFELGVPEYDEVCLTTVAQMEQNINNSLVKTGKRIGFKLNRGKNS